MKIGNKFCKLTPGKTYCDSPILRWKGPMPRSSYAGEVGTVLIFLCIYMLMWHGSSGLLASLYLLWLDSNSSVNPNLVPYLYWLWREAIKIWCFDHSKLVQYNSISIKCLRLAFKYTKDRILFFSQDFISLFMHFMVLAIEPIKILCPSTLFPFVNPNTSNTLSSYLSLLAYSFFRNNSVCLFIEDYWDYFCQSPLLWSSLFLSGTLSTLSIFLYDI